MNRTSEKCRTAASAQKYVTELPKEKNSKKREEEIFKEIAENVLNLLKSSNLYIQEALQTPNRMGSTNRHIILKMLKVKSNRRNPESNIKKPTYHL